MDNEPGVQDTELQKREDLLRRVRTKEEELFPGLFPDGHSYASGTGEEPGKPSYSFHAPSHHVRNELLTPSMVEGMQKAGKSMLSIGSGAAHLEQLLVRGLDVPSSNITLSDIDTSYAPPGFNVVQFDMMQPEWPDFGKKFDYITFPESLVGIHMRRASHDEISASHTQVLTNGLSMLNNGGELRADGVFPSYVHQHLIEHFSNQDVQLTIKPRSLILKKNPMREV